MAGQYLGDSEIKVDKLSPTASGTTLDVSSRRLTNVSTPTSSTDAATKSYVDSAGGSTFAPARSRREGWVFPDGTINAATSIADGTPYYALKAIWYEVNSSGAMVIRDSSSFGANFYYTAANALLVRQNSTEQYVCVSLANATWMNTLCSDSTKRASAISTLKQFCIDNNFTGVELDWEDYGSWTLTQYNNYKTFLYELGNSLHSSGYKLIVDAPPIWNSSTSTTSNEWTSRNSQGYYQFKYEDINTLPVDIMCIMAYDYQYDMSAGTANSPIAWMEDIIKWARQKIDDKSRISVGIPSAGYSGTTGSYTITGRTYSYLSAQTGFGTASRDSASQELIWANAGTSYAAIDDTAIDAKVASAESLGIARISLWHIGGGNKMGTKQKDIDLIPSPYFAELAIVNVRDYGATGDGSTNDNTAIQSAISALPTSGGTLYFPPGTYYMNSAALTGLPSNSKVVGAGRDATTLRVNSGTHNMWTIPASSSKITFQSMTFSMNSSGGHIFAPAGSLQTTNWIDVRAVQNNPAKSILVMTDNGYFDNLWIGCILSHLGATSVPAFDFTAAASSRYNSNSWIRCQINNDSASNTWFFDFATSSASDYLYDNSWRDITGEINNGGFFRGKSVNGFKFDMVNLYDQTTTTKDLFWLGAGSGGTKSRNCSFIDVRRRGGTLGSGLSDILLESGNAQDMTFSGCNTATMSGYVVGLNNNTNCTIIGCRNVTFNNRDATSKIVVGDTDTATLTNKTISGSSNTLSNIAESSVTNLTTDLAAKAPVNNPTFTGTVTLAADPISALQAATKQYVDGLAANVGKRQRVRAATTANITISTALNNADVLDGVTLATGDLVLVKDQSTAAQNGVYMVGVSPARATEFDTYNEHSGSLISVAEGTTNADTLWLCTSNDGGTLDTTAISFSKMVIAGELLASNNLSDLANAGTARTNLGLGSIATQAASSVTITGGSVTGITDITVADGGTGASSASAARTNLGVTIGSDVQAYSSLLTRQAAAPASLTDAATIATDASLACNFRVTLGGNRTLGNPTNAIDGQSFVWEVIQDATGGRTLAFDTKFVFGTDLPNATLVTTANSRSFIGARYNSTADKFYVVAVARGY